MKNLLFILIGFLVWHQCDGQILNWVSVFGGSDSYGEDAGNDFAIDPDGNLVVTGKFHGVVDFDTGPGYAYCTSISGEDVFVLKLNPSGSVIWVKTFGTLGGDEGLSITTDSKGNVYTTGHFGYLRCDMDPDTGTFFLECGSTMSTPTLFLQKLDANGNFISALTYAPLSHLDIIPNEMETDSEDNLYTLGLLSTVGDFDPGPDELFLFGTEGDAYLQKLDSNGILKWAIVIGGDHIDRGYGLDVDVNGNIFVTGLFNGTFDLNPGTGSDVVISSGTWDAYLIKLNPEGYYVWGKSISGPIYEIGKGVTTTSSGEVIWSGLFNSAVDLDPGPGITMHTSVGGSDAFVIKLDIDGNYIWSKSFGGPGNESATSLATDAAGNISIVGYFESGADFDPGPGIHSLTTSPVESTDDYGMQLTSAGDFIFAGSIANHGSPVPASVVPIHVLSNASGDMYICGTTHWGADFDPGPVNGYVPSHGLEDAYVTKWSLTVETENSQLVEPIRVFPNPSQERIMFLSDQIIDSICILDFSGRVITEFQSGNITNSWLDVSLLPPGLYIAVCGLQGTEVKSKLLIQK